MIYLSGVLLPLDHPQLGYINTPRIGGTVPLNCIWAADNGRFSAPHEYTDTGYLGWLDRQERQRCLFATAPDVLADYATTLALSLPLLPRIRAIGFPAALVFQDGYTSGATPWDEFDVAFLGGTTTWKLGYGGQAVADARARGKPVHMGRVNSYKRLRVAAAIGCTSADGTFLKYAPDINVPRMLAWLDQLAAVRFLPL